MKKLFSLLMAATFVVPFAYADQGELDRDAQSHMRKDIPINPKYDPTRGGTFIPDEINVPGELDQFGFASGTLKVDKGSVEQRKSNAKVEANVHMRDVISQLKSERKVSFASNEQLVVKYTAAYLAWVENRHKEEIDSPNADWMWKRLQESFDYKGQIMHLQWALPIVFGSVLCNAEDKAQYVEAMAYVTAIVVEIIVGIICAYYGSPALAVWVCMPIGYVGGAALGEFLLGPTIYDYRCKQ